MLTLTLVVLYVTMSHKSTRGGTNHELADL